MTEEEREQNLIRVYKTSPPIVRAAVNALLDFQKSIDEMGYDLSYYQEDLPKAVAEAIAPWKTCMWCDDFLSWDVHALCGSHLDVPEITDM